MASSDGNSTDIECKNNVMLNSDVPSSGDVCGIELHQKHRHNSSAVPVLLISKTKVVVVIYDCVSDVLLISEAKKLSNKTCLLQSAIYLFSVVINHRYGKFNFLSIIYHCFQEVHVYTKRNMQGRV